MPIEFEQGFVPEPAWPWYRLKDTNIVVNARDWSCDCKQDTFRLSGRVQKPCLHVYALKSWLAKAQI